MAGTTFDPTGFYRAMDEARSLQVTRDETGWTDRFIAPDRPYEALLAFGCAVQHTPHLMREAIAVFETLGIDHYAVTGRQFCCGRPFQRGGHEDAADRISSKSYERFMAVQPNVAVQWCGACMLQYLDVLREQEAPPFEVIHVTAYLARLLKERCDAVPWKQPVRARVALHSHATHPQQDVDTASILELFELIPGVEYRGIVQPPSAGAPCDLKGPTHVGILTDITTSEYRQAQAELEDQLHALGADTLITPYHACQREWCKFASDRMAIREWMSLLAEALGRGVEDRYQTYWQLADPQQIVEQSRAAWESWGLTEAEALRRAEQHFVPKYAVDVPHCNCGPNGCASACATDGEAELAQLLWPVGTAAPVR